MLVLQITLLESLHGGHCVEGVHAAGALFVQLTQSARGSSDLGVVIAALLACYNAILGGGARPVCIEIWLGSPIALSVLGVRSVLAAEPLTGGDPLEVVSHLHGHKYGHGDHKEGCEKDNTPRPGVEILALHLPIVLAQ